MSARKTTIKAAAAAEKTTPVKAEETKTASVKKATVRRSSAKKTAAKESAVRKEVKEQVFVQFAGAEYNLDTIREDVKKAWTAETGKAESEITDIQIYIKPEEHAAYYVVNGEITEGGRKIEL